MTGNERKDYGLSCSMPERQTERSCGPSVRKTPLAEEISIAGLRAQYDTHAKRLLSARPVLARILQKTVEECALFTVEQIMAQLDPDIHISSEPVDPGMERTWIAGDDTRNRLSEEGTVTYDIRFHMHLPAENGQGCGKRLLFDLEAQKEYYVKYRLITRGIYYAARMLSAQKNREFTGSEYSNLKKVYSIWICMNEENLLRTDEAARRMKMSEEDFVARMREERENEKTI